MITQCTNGSGASRLLMLDDKVWIIFWDPWILLHVSRIEWHLINKDQSTSVSNEYSHEGPEHFSSFHNIWIESLYWSLNGFLPTAVHLISQNLPHLKSFKEHFTSCVGINLISNISSRYILPQRDLNTSLTDSTITYHFIAFSMAFYSHFLSLSTAWLLK